ncbi:MAG: RNA-binding S4 domain-containing protein [Bacteroidia bacterium]|nr:RNA-binding S4 domain-containing protein [Bacteroidia bacterium]
MKKYSSGPNSGNRPAARKTAAKSATGKKTFSKKSETKGWNRKSNDTQEKDYRFEAPGSRGKLVRGKKKSEDSPASKRPGSRFGKSDSKPTRTYGSRSASGEGYGERSDSFREKRTPYKRSSSSESGPRFKKSASSDTDRKPYGERRSSSAPRRTDRNSSSERSERPRRSFDGDSSERGFKKSFSSSNSDRPSRSYSKPGTERKDRPSRSADGESSEKGYKKPYSSSRSGSSSSSDRPTGSYSKPGTDRKSSYDRSERPNRSADGDSTERGFKKSYSSSRTSKPGSFSKPGSEPRTRVKSRFERNAEKMEDAISAAKEKSKKQKPSAERDLEGGESIRLNRYISNAGICSRREADEMIAAGLVSINEVVVTELGSKVSKGDVVKFNGSRLSVEEKVYIILNKPKDAITTFDDPEGRNTVMDLFEGKIRERIFPVGRLDRNTTGVLLLTNDGEMAQRLMHPKYEVHKVYKATLDKPLKPTDLWTLSNGVVLEDGPIKPDAIAAPDSKNKNVVGIEIHSGKNRIIHRMFEHLNYKVDKLDRVLYAGLEKGKLKRGEWRPLTEKELKSLKRQLRLK